MKSVCWLKGFISQNGVLHLVRMRRGEEVEIAMSCARVAGKRAKPPHEYCCDACALFGEPRMHAVAKDVYLRLCDGVELAFREGDFEDRRAAWLEESGEDADATADSV